MTTTAFLAGLIRGLSFAGSKTMQKSSFKENEKQMTGKIINTHVAQISYNAIVQFPNLEKKSNSNASKLKVG